MMKRRHSGFQVFSLTLLLHSQQGLSFAPPFTVKDTNCNHHHRDYCYSNQQQQSSLSSLQAATNPFCLFHSRKHKLYRPSHSLYNQKNDNNQQLLRNQQNVSNYYSLHNNNVKNINSTQILATEIHGIVDLPLPSSSSSSSSASHTTKSSPSYTNSKLLYNFDAKNRQQVLVSKINSGGKIDTISLHHHSNLDLDSRKLSQNKALILKKDNKVVLTSTLLVIFVSFTALLCYHNTASGAWRYYLAGGLCAALSHAVPVPIDVIKTRQQVDPDCANMAVVQVARKIVNQDGLQALLVGFGPTVLGYLLEGAVKFGVYEVLKPSMLGFLLQVSQYHANLAFLRTQSMSFIACAGIAGLAASIILCPMEALRIKLVADNKFAKMGWINGGLLVIRLEGWRGLWKALLPMIYKQVPYTITKNASFDVFTKYSYRILLSHGFVLSRRLKLIVPFFAAIAASILSCISSQPGDMLLSLSNANADTNAIASNNSNSSNNTGPQQLSHQSRDRSLQQRHRHCVTHRMALDIYRSKRGMAGFFVGMKTRLVHVGMIVTLQLLLYDFIKRLCGIAATGTT